MPSKPLFEAVVTANHRALAGDEQAGVRPHEFEQSLPVVVLTCFDPRLHPLMPEVLGIAEPDFIWITNAGNVVTGPLSSTARSVALACAMHEGKEIAVIGHSDCRFFQPSRFGLEHWLQQHGIGLGAVCEGLDQFFGRLVDERSNVRLAVRCLRGSPWIARTTPVHGLMVDLDTGRLEWVENGYESLDSSEAAQQPLPAPGSAPPARDLMGGALPPIGSP